MATGEQVFCPDCGRGPFSSDAYLKSHQTQVHGTVGVRAVTRQADFRTLVVDAWTHLNKAIGLLQEIHRRLPPD